jgi:hypothetical protein
MKKLLVLLSIFFSLSCFAQVAINTDGSQPATSSILDVKSNTKGVLLPRMTAQQRKAITVTAADAGLIVFDTDYQTLFMYDGANWMPLAFTPATGMAPVNRSPIPALTGIHEFGEVTAINGNYAFIRSGSYVQNDEGSVYVFERTASGWKQLAELEASDEITDRHFGGSIAVHGDYAVIGTRPVGVTTGAAYVFKRTGNTWIEQVKLVAPDGVPGDQFGHSVAIYGDMILAGAPGKNISAFTDIGAVYVFKRIGNNWTYATQFTGNAMSSNEGFGEVIAMHADYAVIGIPKKAVSGTLQAGGAQVFFYNGTNWVFQAALAPTYVNSNSHFGESVAIYGNRVAVGEPGLSWQGKVNAGWVTVFLHSGPNWLIEENFTANDGQANDAYGTSVALNSEFLLIGAPYKDDAMFNSAGAVYGYKFDPFFQSYFFNRVIRESAVEDGISFGKSVAVDAGSNSYLIGAPGKRFNAGQVSFGYAE